MSDDNSPAFTIATAIGREPVAHRRRRICMRTRLMAVVGLFLGVLATTTDPAAALSCAGPPPDVAEVTITGDVPDAGWYGDVEVPVVLGRVVEGTREQPEAPGDRLALVEVIGGLRLAMVPAEVSIVADDLIGWGHPSYAVGEHVFLRVEEWNLADGDFSGRVADGPCSWNRRYSPTEFESLLALADEYGVSFVTPDSLPDHGADDDDKAVDDKAVDHEVVDAAEPIATSNEGGEGDEGDGNDDEGASVAVAIGALVGVALVGLGAFLVSSRR